MASMWMSLLRRQYVTYNHLLDATSKKDSFSLKSITRLINEVGLISELDGYVLKMLYFLRTFSYQTRVPVQGYYKAQTKIGLLNAYLSFQVVFEASSFTSVVQGQSINSLIGHKEGGRLDLWIAESQVFMEIIQITEEVSQIPSQNFEDPKY